MATQKTTTEQKELSIIRVEHGIIEFSVLGTSPFICNAMSEKTTHELLLPRKKKNAAEKQATLKHEPLREFVSSAYKFRDVDGNQPTRIYHKATAFKGAISKAALDLPGASKAQIGRLVYVMGDQIPLYGVPQLFMAVARQQDAKRTPDVRTRAILPRWACTLRVKFTKPLVKDRDVVNLLAASGIMQGVGDWRTEKGSGNYGAFTIVNPDDPEFLEVVATGGRAAQDAGFANPVCYDSETEELLSWFQVESRRRGFKEVA
jgi:hypothetical protein